jgi:hypothetical protein
VQFKGFWNERITVKSIRRGWKGYGGWRGKGAGRNPPKSPEADNNSPNPLQRVETRGVIHATLSVAPVLVSCRDKNRGASRPKMGLGGGFSILFLRLKGR